MSCMAERARSGVSNHAARAAGAVLGDAAQCAASQDERVTGGFLLLNKTSIKPAIYGEPFVKRRGLFCFAGGIASRCRLRCVSRKDHDRSAVHQLDQDGARWRAGRGDAGIGAGLADLRSHPRRPHRRRRRAADAARRSLASGAAGDGGSILRAARKRPRRSCGRCRWTSPPSRCPCSNILRS